MSTQSSSQLYGGNATLQVEQQIRLLHGLGGFSLVT